MSAMDMIERGKKERLQRPAALQGHIFLHYTKHLPYRQEKGNAVDKGGTGGVCWRKTMEL